MCVLCCWCSRSVGLASHAWCDQCSQNSPIKSSEKDYTDTQLVGKSNPNPIQFQSNPVTTGKSHSRPSHHWQPAPLCRHLTSQDFVRNGRVVRYPPDTQLEPLWQVLQTEGQLAVPGEGAASLCFALCR